MRLQVNVGSSPYRPVKEGIMVSLVPRLKDLLETFSANQIEELRFTSTGALLPHFIPQLWIKSDALYITGIS